jgi:excisionase family DNA binding protein
MDGVYNPCRPNDRLLLGMKGSISEFELGILRSRMLDAARAKARRGELRLTVPIGYLWHREYGLTVDPDLRMQEVVRLVFARFRQLASARQTYLCLAAEKVHFPRPSDGKKLVSFDWTPIRYRCVIGLLKNPFYAGAYIYGKTEKRTTMVDGRARKTYKHGKPFDQWEVVLKDHHEGYIDWAEFERNQKLLALNAYGRAGGVKSGRGGAALLAGMMCCARCGRRLSVAYRGRRPQPVYRCEHPNTQPQQSRCCTFGASRPDEAVARELLRAVEPLAVDAARQAEHTFMQVQAEQRRVRELDLQQARYDATLAERRYAACDPDNRLIAAQLEKNWEVALQRVQACEQQLASLQRAQSEAEQPDFSGLAEDLASAWHAPGVTTRTRQQLLRALVNDIVVDVDDKAREVIFVIHWRGGQHSELRVAKPRSGEHGCRTSDEAVEVIRSMAGRWPDEHIAASLNRMGMPTGQGKTWTAHRVSSLRRVRGIHAYKSAEKDGEWLTMSQAATKLGVTNHHIRRLIKSGLLPAVQVVPCAPYQIRGSDLMNQKIIDAATRTSRPCRVDDADQISMFSST